MTIPVLYALVGVALFCLSLYSVIAGPDPLRKVLAINVMSSGVFLVLVALARRAPGPGPDPVPHAMVITGIVVAVSATALAIVLIQRLQAAALPSAEGPSAEDDPGADS
jgi:multicomponent Na+:H+ antiporter subunit C